VIWSKKKNANKQRSTWIASMVACFLFLLMAVKVYKVPVDEMAGNLFALVLGLVIIIAAAALLGRLIVALRQRFK
jgi:ABC-type Co2+ transport system permease subunit